MRASLRLIYKWWRGNAIQKCKWEEIGALFDGGMEEIGRETRSLNWSISLLFVSDTFFSPIVANIPYFEIKYFV